MPGGPLEAAEACRGARSPTALVAITAFVAFRRGFGPLGGSLLMAFAIPTVVAANVLRVFLSGGIQETWGAEDIRDDWHEALGFAMGLVGLAGVLGLAGAGGRLAAGWDVTVDVSATHDTGGRETVRRGVLPAVVAGLLVISGAGTAYAGRLGCRAVGESLRPVGPDPPATRHLAVGRGRSDPARRDGETRAGSRPLPFDCLLSIVAGSSRVAAGYAAGSDRSGPVRFAATTA